MYYVNTVEVMQLFRAYLEEYNGMITKETAIDALRDAIDIAECTWIYKEGEEE